MIINGMVKLLKVNRTGKTSTDETYVHISAVSYDNEEQFMMVKAFGDTADYLVRNMNGARRAFISGVATLDTYEDTVMIAKNVKLAGVVRKIEFPVVVEKVSLSVVVNTAQFIDKRRENAQDLDEEVVETEEAVGEDAEFEVVDEDIKIGSAPSDLNEPEKIIVEEDKPSKAAKAATVSTAKKKVIKKKAAR